MTTTRTAEHLKLKERKPNKGTKHQQHKKERERKRERESERET